MDTLFNVNTFGHRVEVPPPHARPASCIISQRRILPKGVSSDYALDPNKRWYVLRVTYGREEKAYGIITEEKEDVFMPCQYVLKERNGKKIWTVSPLLPNIVFVYATREGVEKILSKNALQPTPFLKYFRNRLLPKDNEGKNPPLVIGESVMRSFIKAVSVNNDHSMIVDRRQCHFRSGDKVKVTEGEFKGVEGYVARVAGQQRVVIELLDSCCFATAYVPSAFLSKVNR